jgi:hypothetical protein
MTLPENQLPSAKSVIKKQSWKGSLMWERETFSISLEEQLKIYGTDRERVNMRIGYAIGHESFHQVID